MRLSPYRLKAVAPLVVATVLALTAATAVGLEPSPARPIPDSAFGPVALTTLPAPTLDLRPLADPVVPTAPPPRPQPAVPVPKPIVKVKSIAPKTTHSISGRASWYCRAGQSICTVNHPDGSGFDAYAAAGPGLRAAIGPSWRGTIVYVDGIRVKLIDWCQCRGGSTGVEKLLDLYYDVFARTGSPVTIRW